MSTYGYARVSSKGQDLYGNSLGEQETALRAAGAETVFHDAISGMKSSRPQFEALLSRLKPGDTLIVTKLDRFSRSAMYGAAKIQELVNSGISIHILNMGLVNNTPVGMLMVRILFSFAEFERDNIAERTREGKEAARAKDPNWHTGPLPSPLDSLSLSVLSRYTQGLLTLDDSLAALNVSRTTFFKRLRRYRANH
jgi:DNA invertase Pin-like site-specific DNA recombinase